MIENIITDNKGGKNVIDATLCQACIVNDECTVFL